MGGVYGMAEVWPSSIRQCRENVEKCRMLNRQELTFATWHLLTRHEMDILLQPASVVLTLRFECVSALVTNVNATQKRGEGCNGQLRSEWMVLL